MWPEVQYLLPEVIIAVGAMLLLLLGAFRPRRDALPQWLALATLLAAGGVLAQQSTGAVPSGEAVAGDQMAGFFRALALAGGLLLVLMQRGRVEHGFPEQVGCVLLATLGVMLAAAGDDLILVFVGLELISIPTYILLYIGGDRSARQESAIKYFFLSILASAVFLYGLSFVYGVSGEMQLSQIAGALADSSRAPGAYPLAHLGMVLVLAGLAFKITAVPFHFYAPDVYEGTTHGNAALLSVLPKAAGLAVLIRFTVIALGGVELYGWHLTLALAVLTMTLGNVVALWQENVRRLLAYSAIAHAGYMLIGLTAAMAAITMPSAQTLWDGSMAVLIYMVTYAFATIGVFAALAALEKNEHIDRVDQLRGLAWSPVPGKRFLAWTMAACLLSLTGIPPLAGFWGKLAVFFSALSVGGSPLGEATQTQHWLVGLAVVGVVNAAIAAAYYLRVVAVMFFVPEEAQEAKQADSWQPLWGPAVAAFACVLLVVVIGLAPGRWLEAARQASPGNTSPASQLSTERNPPTESPL